MGRGQELLDAAREGDRRTVEKILGQIVTKRSGPFPSLRRGAGVNVQDDNGYTPLHHACLNGHKEIVRLLLSVPASPCVVDKKGATPLHLAAFKGDGDVVGMLLAHNDPPCEVDKLTLDHESALLIAAQFGFISVVAQLVARGADVTIKNKRDESALDLAAQYGRLATVQHLIQVRPQLLDLYRYPISRTMMFTSTPLHRASKNGRKSVVKALIDAGMDPNVKSYNGTALHEAARYGQASVIRILLKKGADLNAKDNDRKTIYDVLDEYPEEATRKVREVIREYETYATAYSDEDLPPFPVPDSSPTAIMITRKHTKPTTGKLSASKKASNNLDDNNSNVTNTHINDTKVPPPELTESFKSFNSDEDEFRDRSISASSVAKSCKKQRVVDESVIVKQSQLVKEIQTRNNITKKISNVSSTNELRPNSQGSECEGLYENLRKTPLNNRRSSSHSRSGNALSSNSWDSNSLKKRPKPLPKPPVSAEYGNNNDEVDYVNRQMVAAMSNYTEGIYGNLGTINVPDEVKLRTVDSTDKLQQEPYVTMDGLKESQRSTMISDYVTCNHIKSSRSNSVNGDGSQYDTSYVCMNPKQQREKRMSIPEYVTAGRFKTDSFHIKGDLGCIYNSPDYDYFYELIPRTGSGSVTPFIKRKEKANPMPCYCHEGPDRDKKIKEKIYCKDFRESQQYFSCLNINMRHEEFSINDLSDSNRIADNSKDSEDNYSDDENKRRTTTNSTQDSENEFNPVTKIVKKKFSQVRQVLTDWS